LDQVRTIAFLDLATPTAYHSIYGNRKAGGALPISVVAVDETIEQ
jgi:hypothetical protein